MKKKRMSFQSRLYLYILSLTVVIFGCIVLVVDYYSRVREEKQASQYTFALQNTTKQNIYDEFDWMESTVELTVKHVQTTYKKDHFRAMEFIGQLVLNNSMILGVGYVDFANDKVDYVYSDDRQQIMYKTIPQQDYDYTKSQWYRKAMSGARGEWTEPYVDSTGSHKRIVSYAMPVKGDDHKVRGIVVVDVSLVKLVDELSTVRPYDNSYSMILSKRGTVMAHPDTALLMRENIFSLASVFHDDDYTVIGHRIMSSKKGYLHCKLGGTDMLVCYDHLPRIGWSVVSVCPYSTVMLELGSITFTVMAIVLVGIILLLVGIRILLSRVVRPIRQMTDTAYHIAKGDFDATLPDMDSDDDFGRLRAAFDHMQHSLKTYMKDLEMATKAKEMINGELKVAHKIQMEILPIDFVLNQGYEDVDIDAYLAPARQVGGDFYDFCMKGDKMFFAIGDVSGKGIAASIVMAMTCTLFRSLLNEHDSPSEIMKMINGSLSHNNKVEMFVTMFIGVIDIATGEMTYSNAGHNAPYVFSAGEGCSKLPMKSRLPLALYADVKYEDERYTLKKGQSLLLYTDGLTEAENSEREQYGARRLESLLATLGGKTSHEVICAIRSGLKQFVGGGGAERRPYAIHPELWRVPHIHCGQPRGRDGQVPRLHRRGRRGAGAPETHTAEAEARAGRGFGERYKLRLPQGR